MALRTKWTDERVEDLAKITYHNDGVLEDVGKVIERLQYRVQELEGREKLRARSRFEQFAIGAALMSPVVTLILGLVYHH